jgi:hypothetical protein
MRLLLPSSRIDTVRQAGQLLLLATLLGLLPSTAGAVVYDVTVDTTPLAGQAVDLQFDVIDGDVATNNAITISDFMDGTLGAGTENCTPFAGCVSGSLLSTLTIDDRNFLNEWLQATTLDTTLTFRLTATTNFDTSGGSSVPDDFAFSISAPGIGTPLFRLDLDGTATGGLDITAGTGLVVSVVLTQIPEPTTLALFGAGAVGLLGFGWRRRQA